MFRGFIAKKRKGRREARMFARYINAEDLEKALATLDMVIFILQDDIQRPVLGIEANSKVPAGTFESIEAAKDALINVAGQISDIDSPGVYYSTMLGFHDDDHVLVYAITYELYGNEGSFEIYDSDDLLETREWERYALPK